ncbi:MAG: peptide-methionine (S)-S-oxide reductase MsrA [Caldimonas sp.]
MTRTTFAPLSTPRRTALFAGLVAALAIGAFAPQFGSAGEAAVKIAPPAVDTTTNASGTQTAVFAGGCFWGVQGVFQRVHGVVQAVSGYAGGTEKTAVYELVGSGLTSHAEAVKITYDPKKVSYGTLLQIYFSVAHDPTQLNRQDPDNGPQYRSAVFHADAAQKETTEKYIAQLDAAKSYSKKIVTQVVPLTAFYPAEAYHQDYLTLNPTQGYIARYDLPKIVNLKAIFPQQYRAEPALVMARAKAQ